MAEKHIYNKLYSDECYALVPQESKDICEDFLRECKARKLAASTQFQYEHDCKWICCFVQKHLGNKSLLELTKRSFRDFIIICSETYGLSSARCNRLLSCIHSLLDFCENDDELYADYTRNASEKVKGLPKDPVREIVFIPDSLVEKLYNKLMEEERYKEATLEALLYDCGARRNEIAQCDRASLQEGKNASTTVIGKRGKKFKLLFFRRTKEAFAKYEATREDKIDLLFPASDGSPAYDWIYNTVVSWRKDLKELSGKDYACNPHSWRHSFVQNLITGEHYLCREKDLGAIPLEKIKTLCHHESSDTTLHYAQDNSERDIEELFGISLDDD